MLRLGRERESLNVVDDQIGAPTTAAELARATHAITKGIAAGEFGAPSRVGRHLPHDLRRQRLMVRIRTRNLSACTRTSRRKTPVVNPIATSAYPTPAKRPHNSVLSNEKLTRTFGVRLAPWETALDEVLKAIPAQPKP